MNIVSLFDGMSCAQIGANKVGLQIENYFASEIEEKPILVTQANYPNTVQLGDINNYKKWNLPSEIDLMIAGSPCQDLSIIKTGFGTDTGLQGDKSKLFFKFVECLNLYKPKHFVLENVPMKQTEADVISNLLGVQPYLINSDCFSAQDRKRFYWTSIQVDMNQLQPSPLVLKDVMESNVHEKYFYKDPSKWRITWNGENERVCATLEGNYKMLKMAKRIYNPEFKAPTLTAVCGGNHHVKVWDGGRARKLTPLEYERLQNVPENYSAMVANSHRYKMLGNAFTVDAISFILQNLKHDL